MLINETLSNVINSPVRSIVAKVEVYDSTSTLVYTFQHSDRLIEFTVERVSETGKFFGIGICQKANMKIIDTNREISIPTDYHFRIAVGANGEWVYPFPTFYPTQTRRDENTNVLTIYGYDAIYDAATNYVSDLEITAPYTVQEFAAACASVLGIQSVSVVRVDAAETCFSTSFATGANFEGTETIREALDDVAEATQTIYYLNGEDILVFKRLSEATVDKTIGKSLYFTLDNNEGRRLQTICSATELGDNYSASSTAIGTTQYVRENAFWNINDDVATLVDNAVAAVGGLSIHQFELDWRGDFLVELGDRLAIETKNGDFIYTFLLVDKVSYNGTYAQATDWEYNDDDTETESNPTSLGDALKQTYAKVDKANKQIDIVVSEVSQYDERITNAETSASDAKAAADENVSEIETLKTQVASLQLNTDSISASVSRVETNTQTSLDNMNAEINTLSEKVNATITADDVSLQIQEELSNGVTSITTTTGYTFNQDGMTVSKSGSEMQTQITEDGMTVSKNGETMLTANNQGVDAVNLHATTYLIVGLHSRFEDYGSGRTGCFWIGE